MNRHHLLRRLHRTLVPVAALPLLLTALSGSIYGALSARGIEAFWLMKLHTGNFGAVNLQPYDSTLLGVLTLFVAVSGLGLLLAPWTGRKPIP
ncbi:hypothetical protein KBY82_02770 [Cyanobium sp. AMD-g]|nr:hypothetical protein [Cyanobium sp. AMD-g]MCP9929703.1 hypothetical protein [Cyanobium sp. AMD-g]